VRDGIVMLSTMKKEKDCALPFNATIEIKLKLDIFLRHYKVNKQNRTLCNWLMSMLVGKYYIMYRHISNPKLNKKNAFTIK
jgi:hypothetical protein